MKMAKLLTVEHILAKLVTGAALSQVQQSAGNEMMSGDTDLAGKTTTGESDLVLSGVAESPIQSQTMPATPDPVPAKARTWKRSSKSKTSAGDSPVNIGSAPPPDNAVKVGAVPAQGDAAQSSLDAFVQDLFGGHVVFVDGRFMTYREGRWLALHQLAEVEKPISRFLGAGVNVRKIDELVKQLKLRCAEIALPAPVPNLVCFKNGTLDPFTGILHQHSSANWLRNKIDNLYDPKAECPTWLRSLDEIFREDIDKMQKILLLKQWFGYTLVPMTMYRKFLVMHGAGSNGKSVILSVMAKMIGEENISRAMAERIGKKEVLADFDGKLLNISPELSDNAWKYSNYIKAVVDGEDHVQARQLYKNVISFKPITRLVMATNTLPRVVDDSDGFFSRPMILTFNRQFKEAEQNKQLIDELLAELPGILRWAVEGLQQLVADNQFVVPVSSEAVKTRYRIESDPVLLFIEECLEADPDGAGILVRDMFAAYCNWVRAYRLDTKINKFAFGKRMSKAGFEQRHTRIGDNWLVRAIGAPAANVMAA
jgi:putative DNA primase/helicase